MMLRKGKWLVELFFFQKGVFSRWEALMDRIGMILFDILSAKSTFSARSIASNKFDIKSNSISGNDVFE